MLAAGAAAPAIECNLIEGAAFSLFEQLKQGPVLLAFFKISCPTCQFTLPFLDRLHSPDLAAGPRLFGISQDQADMTREFSHHFGIHFPLLLDPASSNYPASNAYGITNVPSLFLVESNRKIGWSLNGFHRKELENLGEQFGRSPFTKGERVPEMRPG